MLCLQGHEPDGAADDDATSHNRQLRISSVNCSAKNKGRRDRVLWDARDVPVKITQWALLVQLDR